MKNLIALIFCATVFFANTSAQVYLCEGYTEGSSGGGPRGQTCSFSSNEFLNFYRMQTSWYPTSNIPIKTINIAFIVRQRTDPNNPGNYTQNNPAHMQLLNDIVSEMNSYLSNNETPSDPRTAVCGSSCYVQDTRLRVNRVALIFTQNDATYGNVNSTANAVSPNEVINIFFKGDNLSSGGGCIPGGIAFGGNIIMGNQLCSNSPAWAIAGNVLHEIFHVMGVNHVYANGSCGGSSWFGEDISNVNHIDYLTDVFGNSGTHTWETYLYNGCIGGANNCDPFANSNDNCTNNFMGSRGRFISKMQAGRIHRNAMTNATIRRYICGYSSTPYLVQNNETWDFNIKFYQDIVVKAGKTLTITCQLSMVPGSKIIVEQNARLIVDGGVITTGTSYGCSGLWQGIEVWGNASQHQYTYGSNQLYQGYVELKNEAIIENANTAISLGKAGDWQMLNTGGIVQAYGNSVFRNNKRDVEFLKYQNFNPSNPNIKRPNLSYFRNCVFETTATLNDGSNPSNHVTMWNVDGVRFFACRFENSNPNATSLSQLGNGIYTEDAHFIVTGCDWNLICQLGQCCGHSPNIFKHLNYGIRTKHVSGTQYNYNVDKNTFENCFVNVYNEGVNNAIITRNNHTIGKPRFGSVYAAGVEFNTGTGYRIEENNLTRDPNPNVWFSLGTWMTNTGMNNNQVYKNTLTGLNFGNYAYQRNRGYDVSTGLYSGLAFLCNTHTLINGNDIYINGTDPVNDGVRQYQGKLNSTNTNAINSAGNIFTRSGINSESDISNPNTPNITYFYDGSANISNPKYPFYVTTNRVTRAPLTANTCPSMFTSGGFGKNSEIVELGINNGKLTEDVRQQLLLDYQAYDQSLNQFRALYASLVDGGNTSQLKQTVESSWPTETWQLRQNLLGKSPYLSKEVLKESSDKTNVLPNAILFEVLAANPDGLKDEELIKHLSEKVNPLPAWMVDLLRDESGQTTPRTFLEASISNSKAQRDQVITYLVHDMLSDRGDNQEINHPQLRSWLAAYQTPHGDYQVVDDYFETGDYSAGLSILSTVPTIYKLNEKEREEFDGLQSLFNVLAGVHSSNRNIFLLDESERGIIQDLADNGEGIAKVRACNIISFVYGTECDYGLMLPDETQSFKADKAPVGKDNPLLPSVNVFPNPAKDYVEFSYNLPTGAMEGTLTITDLKGVVIFRQQLSTKYGQIAIDTREWQQGTYIYTLSSNGNSVSNQKFVLIK